MRVLISGCGCVGSALGLLLAAQGHTAFGLRRNTRALPPAILPVQADLSTSLPPDALPPKLDAVIYAASPARSTDETYEAAYVDGPCNLLIGAFFQGLTVQICQRGRHPDSYGIGAGEAARVEVDPGDSTPYQSFGV